MNFLCMFTFWEKSCSVCTVQCAIIIFVLLLTSFTNMLDGVSVLLCLLMCNFSASDKLQFSVGHVVLESDGTEIDGDEELNAFAGSTLLALKDGESWQPDTTEPVPPAASDVSVEISSVPTSTGELPIWALFMCDDMSHLTLAGVQDWGKCLFRMIFRPNRLWRIWPNVTAVQFLVTQNQAYMCVEMPLIHIYDFCPPGHVQPLHM